MTSRRSTSSALAPGSWRKTSTIGTLICGSSSRGVTSTAKAPSRSEATTSSGVSFESRKAAATLPGEAHRLARLAQAQRLAARALGQARRRGARPGRFVGTHRCTSGRPPSAGASQAAAAGAAARPSATVSPPARPERISTRPSAATSPTVTTRDWARPSLVADDDQGEAAALDQRRARHAHRVAAPDRRESPARRRRRRRPRPAARSSPCRRG